jgi:hypothetical protein
MTGAVRSMCFVLATLPGFLVANPALAETRSVSDEAPASQAADDNLAADAPVAPPTETVVQLKAEQPLTLVAAPPPPTVSARLVGFLTGLVWSAGANR